MFFIVATIFLSCSIANYSSDYNSEFGNSSTPRDIITPGLTDSSTPPEIVTTVPNSPTLTRATFADRSLSYDTFQDGTNNTSLIASEESFYSRNKNDKYIFLIKTLCCCSAILVTAGGIKALADQ